MVTVPRIAAVSYLDTLPFIYGLQHADALREGLLLSDFQTSVTHFRAREADIALVPADVVPALEGARIVTQYCVGAPDASLVEALRLAEPDAPILDRFAEGGPLAPLVAQKRRRPFAYALWVARAETDPEVIEQLQLALTAGLEQSYEAVVEAGYDRKPYDAYAYLTRVDYIFDNQKHKALEKFWSEGLKAALRANPG